MDTARVGRGSGAAGFLGGLALILILAWGGLAGAADTVALTYEGASTIGTKVLPEATKLFTQKTGIPFGAIGTAGAGAGFTAVVAGQVAFGGLASEPSDKEKAQLTDIEVIGYDVMGVFLNPKNPVKTLTMLTPGLVSFFEKKVLFPNPR